MVHLWAPTGGSKKQPPNKAKTKPIKIDLVGIFSFKLSFGTIQELYKLTNVSVVPSG